MRFDRVQASDGLGYTFTLLGKRVLIIYTIIYILELLCEHWFNLQIISYLNLIPFKESNFHIWQIITHPFIHDPRSPISFLLNCLMFFFFAGSVENAIGTNRFLILFYFSALGGALCGMGLSSFSAFNYPFMGMMPSLLSTIVIFGLLKPEATILLMFILPVKAKFISYITVLITFLTFLAKANPYGAYHLGGILFGYLYFRSMDGLLDYRIIYMKYLKWRMNRNKARFKVINGKKDSGDNNKPTLH
ncbi:MAG: rhomboid family intramembrane serine protease [Desulfobacterales bacterium]|jgi:membrane associated rhomboid family serine protease|nr:rhomboid family intramembrane serine protease [Desulfobacteraceae bacterium]MBT7085446.1 rhomboid family intramembrane serine protease [Desulfobacterales bacterium]MBT7696051.1 rhomboid family intramembrane serine protease [Desulfobacterales bacterium]